MANRYWVAGGTGDWNSTTNWSTSSGGASGASVPGSSDAALLDANSGAGTVTLDISPDIQTLTCTGFTGTLAFGTNTISLNSTGTIFTGATTMTVTGTPLIICTNNSATSRTINPTAVTEANSISFRVTAGTGTLTFGAGAVRDIDFTDGTNPTGFGGSLSTFVVTIYGNLKASTGMTVVSSANTMTFAATSGTKTIDTAGVTFDRSFTFNGVGGTFQLAAALTSGASRICTLTNGTLDLNGYTLTTGLFSSNNSNTRTLAFGSAGKIVLTATTGTVLSMSTATNFTYTGTSRIEVTASGAGRTITPPSTNAVESNVLSIYVTTGSDTVTIGGAARFLNFDLTGFAGTLTYASSSRYFGDLVFVSGMTLGTVAASFVFSKTSGTQTITTAGKTIGAGVTIDASGATVSLQDALSLTGTLTLTNGTLTTNGYAVTAGIFSSSNSNTRALNLGASTVSITSTGTAWNITDPTNMTLNAGTSTITTSGTTASITFVGGGLTYYNVTFGATYYNTALSGANTFNNLTVASPAGVGRRTLSLSANQTVSGTLTCSGSAPNIRPRITGAAGGNTITAAAVSLAQADFFDITAAGVSSPWSGTNLGDGGGNTNITFAAPKTVYWNQPAGGNWSDVAWALTSGGAVGANNFPLGQDSVILDNTGVGASSTIVMDYGWLIGSLSAGSLTNALTINWNVFGNLTATTLSNVTFSSAITITYTSGAWGIDTLTSTATITTAGVSIPIATVNFNSPSNTMVLGDNFTSTGTVVGLAAGTLNLNGKTLTCVTFDGTFTDLLARTIAFNGGQINVTGNAATVWACEDLTNFSYTGTPTVNFTYSGSTGTRTINNGSSAGGTESNAVSMNITAGTDGVTLSTTGTVLNLNYTGYSGAGNLPGFIYGNLTLSATQTITASGTGATFAATSGTKTVTTNGVTIDRPLVFQGVGGTWSLQDALTLGATRALGLFAGTLNTNGYAVSCGQFNASDSGATGNRTLNLGATSFTAVGTSTATMSWQIETTTYTFTLNAGTSTIYMAEAYSGSSTQDFIGGGKTYYNVVYSGGQPSTIYGSNTFNSISNSTQPLALSFEAGTTQTVNQFNVSGTSGNLVTLTSATPGSQWSLAKNTGTNVVVSNCSITDSAATPAGYWFAPTSQGNVDGGNNTGWNFNASGSSFGNFFML
jgi:hypothetical protein